MLEMGVKWPFVSRQFWASVSSIYFVEYFIYLNFIFADFEANTGQTFWGKNCNSGHSDHALHSVSELSACIKSNDVTNSLVTNDV